jgi:hypothetical protein
VAISVLGIGELSRRVRLLEGDSGAAEASFGLDCVVKSSLMVLPECFRFNALVLADIGRTWGWTREMVNAELSMLKPRRWQ